MNRPIIADNKPKSIMLNKGKEHYFCTCGRSKNQPFCDGSHVGSGLAPRAFTADADGEVWLCQCKHTKTPPYCDGTHKAFSDAQVQTRP